MKTSCIPLSRLAIVLVSLGMLAATGCKHVGPMTVAVDRFDYRTAIGESWKHQTLLNIVKLRYMDLPVFVDVASVVSGYSLETALSAGGSPEGHPLLLQFKEARSSVLAPYAADIQSLVDLGNSFQVIRDIRPFSFGRDTVLRLVVFPLVPVAQLALTVIRLEELIKELVGSVFLMPETNVPR